LCFVVGCYDPFVFVSIFSRFLRKAKTYSYTKDIWQIQPFLDDHGRRREKRSMGSISCDSLPKADCHRAGLGLYCLASCSLSFVNGPAGGFLQIVQLWCALAVAWVTD
jgi:hypothetical protein